MIIDYDKYSLIINNKRVLINSAAFHYFRCPGEKTWRDRLSKIKACGYNTVDLYFCWGFHSKKQGVYDFTGIRDVRKLLEIASELGLFVIARPGPFINAELSLGGLPEWLLNVPDIIIRNKQDGNFVYSEPYMKALKEWYSRIIPIINEFHNVIAFQIENEYFTNEAEPDYLQELYDLSRSLGVKAPIFHNDALAVGLYSDIVNIYAFDSYPTINMKYDWKDMPDSFGVLDNAESNIKECCPDSPLFIAELQAGWFDKWGGRGYENIWQKFKKEHINIVTKTALSQGITMFNHYMGCGGTSWGKLACAEVYTSYDFVAPISESGLLRENYYKAKEINTFLNSFNFASTDLVSESNENNIFIRLRQDNLNSCKWLFVRNLNKTEHNLTVLDKYTLNIKPFDMKILPVGLNLKACTITFSSFEILSRVEKDNHEIIYMLIGEDCELFLSDGTTIKSENIKDSDSFKFDNTEFIFLIPEVADKNLAEEPEPELKNWKVFRCAPEIDLNYDYSDWNMLIEPEKFDCISNRVYEDYIWYKGHFKHVPDRIEINAKHCYAVYLNGKQIYSHDSHHFDHGHEISESITFEIDQKLVHRDGQNQLTVLAQNLGFDKGFQNELIMPRGILSFKTNPEKEIEWRIRGGLTPVIEEWDFVPEKNLENSSDNPYLLYLQASFELNHNKSTPLELDLTEAEFNKADIYLNSYLIGRFWKTKGPQLKFYLPEEFLKSDNKLSLIIWDREGYYQDYEDYKSKLPCVKIKIRNIKKF